MRMAVCVGGWEMEDGRFRCEDGCLHGRMGGLGVRMAVCVGGWEV